MYTLHWPKQVLPGCCTAPVYDIGICPMIKNVGNIVLEHAVMFHSLNKQSYNVQLTDWFSLVLVKDLAVAPIHVGYVYRVAICPVDFPNVKEYNYRDIAHYIFTVLLYNKFLVLNEFVQFSCSSWELLTLFLFIYLHWITLQILWTSFIFMREAWEFTVIKTRQSVMSTLEGFCFCSNKMKIS